MKIGIIGTGNVGSALAARLSEVGYEVEFGVRGPSEVVDGVQSRPIGNVVASSDVVFLAVPAAAIEPLATGYDWRAKVVVDCANPLRFDGGPVWDPPAEGSTAQQFASLAEDARVVKAFNTFGAEFHRDPTTVPGGATLLMAGDDAEAKATVAAIGTQAGFAPLDAGPLRNAGPLENVAIVWIHLALVGGEGRNHAFQWVDAAT